MGKGGAINRRKDRGKKKAAAPKAEEPLDWVQCTGCDKWRRIPASIVEKLGEEDEWFCKENPDKAMASCDAPEEAATALAREAFKRWKQRNDGEMIDDITVLVAALRNIESRSAAGSSRRSSMDRLSRGSGSSHGSQRSLKGSATHVFV